MSKKRGLSVEEKRNRLLEVFHESSDVFVLKEVEKLGTKKGITPQSIKDILQSLIDDDLVHQEKIGSANYFWSFPTEASMMIEREWNKTQDAIRTTGTKKDDLRQKIEAQRIGREDSTERREKEQTMQELKTKVAELHAELDRYNDADPELVAKMQEGAHVAKDAANRWLDNLFALQSWCRKQFPGMESEVQKLFEQNGIHCDEIDYLD